jgi:hypothetical protein
MPPEQPSMCWSAPKPRDCKKVLASSKETSVYTAMSEL